MKKVLAVVTNHGVYNSTGDITGLWLSELVHFIEVMDGAGISVDIASPKGGAVPLDPNSKLPRMLDEACVLFLETPEQSQWLQNSLPLESLRADDYEAVYFAGGHGTMYDFVDNPAVAKTLHAFNQQGKVISAVCHGVGALLNPVGEAQQALINGKIVTGYSDMEEVLALVDGKVPFSLETALIETGAQYSKAEGPFQSYVQTDGTLITGQNPQSTKEMAEAVLQKLGM